MIYNSTCIKVILISLSVVFLGGGGNCPGGNYLGLIVQGVIVLEPYMYTVYRYQHFVIGYAGELQKNKQITNKLYIKCATCFDSDRSPMVGHLCDERTIRQYRNVSPTKRNYAIGRDKEVDGGGTEYIQARNATFFGPQP